MNMQMPPDSALRELDSAALSKLETPCYIFDPAVVIEDHRQLKEELGTPLIVSMKANPVLDLLVRCNHAFVDGIEIASLGELNVTVGRMTVPRYVNTPALDATLIGAALACRATLIVDSPHQLEMIAAAAKKARGPIKLALRLNASSLCGTQLRSNDHFGMDIETMWDVVRELEKTSMAVSGLHVFAGSNTFKECAEAIVSHVSSIVADFAGHPAANLEFVNLGGGIPANWRDAGIDFKAYRDKLVKLQERVTVIHEAGRAVFSRAGIFATRVVAVKKLGGKTIVVCDGGMAHCFSLAQTEAFLKKPAVPTVVRMQTSESASIVEDGPIAVVGNSCNKADVIGHIEGACPQPGDMLIFNQCGAYHTYSPSGFLNLRPVQRYILS